MKKPINTIQPENTTKATYPWFIATLSVLALAFILGISLAVIEWPLHQPQTDSSLQERRAIIPCPFCNADSVLLHQVYVCGGGTGSAHRFEVPNPETRAGGAAK